MAKTYKESGVNYQLMDVFKNACLEAGGNQSELLEFKNFYLTDVLEGLGSLSKLADEIYFKTGHDYYYQVGWGNAATVLNDLVTVGAKPLTSKLFVGAGEESFFADQTRLQSLIDGFQAGIKYSGAKWNGGETQTLVDVIEKDSFVLAGSANGIIMPKSRLIQDRKISVGDRIVFVMSSGLHTNGITLVRQLFEDDVPTLIEAIEPKTLIYAPLVSELLEKRTRINFTSHITGHGWRKIMRSKRDLVYNITEIPSPQPIFNKIQEKSGMSLEQMYGDYNMGLGFMFVLPKPSVKKVISTAEELGFCAFEAGNVEEGERKVLINPLGFPLKGDSLTIR